MGSYSFFNQGIPIYATEAFQSPDRPGVQWHDLLTVFLDPTRGSGGILSVINGVGGPSTAAQASAPVDVVSYPCGQGGGTRARGPWAAPSPSRPRARVASALQVRRRCKAGSGRRW